MMSPTTDDHGAVQMRFAVALYTQGDQQGLGTTRTETGVILQRDPDTLYGPDVMFLAKRAFPLHLSTEGYWESIPTLVVEVRSKNDTQSEIDEKIRDYLAAGVELVWLAEPQRKVVSEHRPGAAAIERGLSDILTADDIIAGFRLPVSGMFPT
jgi:Uma2 family endonuclease